MAVQQCRAHLPASGVLVRNECRDDALPAAAVALQLGGGGVVHLSAQDTRVRPAASMRGPACVE